jgi:tetratricopeptide (TPR) repeat protein
VTIVVLFERKRALLQRKRLERAKDCLNDNQLEEGLTSIMQYLTDDSNPSAESLHVCGELLWKQGAFEEAIDMVTKCLNLDPFNPSSYYIRGDCYVQLQQYEQGRAEMLKFLKLEKPTIELLLSLGKCNATIGDLSQALLYFNQAIEMEPESDPYLYFLRGDLFTKLGESEKARTDFNKILEIDPMFVKPYEQNAQECVEKGDLSGAISIYESLLKIDPERPEYYLNCGLLLYELNDLEQALGLITSCINIINQYGDSSPRSEVSPSGFDVKGTQHVYVTRGKIYFEMQEIDKAYIDFTMSINIASEKKNNTEVDDLTLVDALRLRAECSLVKNRLQDAKDDYERIITEFSDDMCENVQIVYKFLAEYYYEFVRDYEKSLKLFMGAWRTGSLMYDIASNVSSGYPHALAEHEPDVMEVKSNAVTPSSKPTSKSPSRNPTPRTGTAGSKVQIQEPEQEVVDPPDVLEVSESISPKESVESSSEPTPRLGYQGKYEQDTREMFAHCLVIAFVEYQTEQKKIKEEEEQRQLLQSQSASTKDKKAPPKKDTKPSTGKVGTKPEQLPTLFEIAIASYNQPYCEVLGVYQEPVVAFRDKWAFYEEKFLGKLPPQPGEIVESKSRASSAKKTGKAETKAKATPTKKK